jgi:hypothetical protein
MQSNINRIEKRRYFTWWDVPIWTSNIWTTHNGLCFHFFHRLLAPRMCEMCFAFQTFVWRILYLFFIIFLLLFSKYARQQQSCNVFNRSTSHGFVAQNFKEIFSWRSRTHSNTRKSVGPPWTIDHPDAKISAWQHTTLTIERYLCPWRESNPQSHQTRGSNPTS